MPRLGGREGGREGDTGRRDEAWGHFAEFQTLVRPELRGSSGSAPGSISTASGSAGGKERVTRTFPFPATSDSSFPIYKHFSIKEDRQNLTSCKPPTTPRQIQSG